MNKNPIKVLVVDDSQVARMLLIHLLTADPEIQVIGQVPDGQSALEFVRDRKPDVVLMDVHMPGMDGFEATRRIMETNPVPIIICSAASNPREVATTFRLLEAGAVACVEKPAGPGHENFEALADALRQTVRLMSEVKVVRRWHRVKRPLPAEFPSTPAPQVTTTPGKVRMIGIGASTGGPPVLQTLLSALPKDFSVPVLIVQHIAPGFLAGFAEWLSQTTGFQIHVGAHGLHPLPGHIYLAPDDFHMGVGAGGRIILSREPAENGLRPAVSYLFRTLAAEMAANCVGVLLTGMGRDGAAELRVMRDRGAVTIAQNRETSVVYGMPGTAVALEAATHILSPDAISELLLKLVQPPNQTRD